MKNSQEQIHDWQDKVRAQFGNEGKLYEYLFETLENFFYRYLETSESKNLKVQELAKGTYGAFGFESSMVEALKIKHVDAHKGIMELAKRIPKAQKPLVRLGLGVSIKEFTADKGNLVVFSEIHWGFPEFSDKASSVRKEITFKYVELQEFRKGLALKLEEAAELFT